MLSAIDVIKVYAVTWRYFMVFIMGNLCWHCLKLGQGHPKVMIYINFVELLSMMLHAKLQNHRPSGSEKEYF